MHLVYFGLSGVAQVGFVREEGGVWQYLATLLRVGLRNYPSLDFSLIGCIFGLEDSFAILHDCFVATCFIVFCLLVSLGLRSLVVFFITAYEFGEFCHFATQGLQLPLFFCESLFVLLSSFEFLVALSCELFDFLVAVLMDLLEFCELLTHGLPLLIVDYVLALLLELVGVRFGWSDSWVVLIVVFPVSFF